MHQSDLEKTEFRKLWIYNPDPILTAGKCGFAISEVPPVGPLGRLGGMV
jgi:hypothetical protein